MKFLHFLVPDELLQAIDNWRYANHFPTRAAAIKWLLEWALAQKPSP